MLLKIQNFLIKTLFFVPFLFFLVNITRNPFYIQQVLVICILSLLVILKFFENFRQKNFEFQKLMLTEKFLISFFLLCFVSWGIAFFKFPEYKIAIFNEGLKGFNLIFFNSLLVYFLPNYFIKDQKTESSIFKFLFFAAFLSSFYGIFQFFGVELIWQTDVNPFGNRCVSTFGNPNFLSSFLIMLLPVGFTNVFTKKGFDRFFYAGICCVMIFALICTMTRSSWLGFSVGIFLYLVLFLSQKTKNIKKILRFGVVLTLIFGAILWATPFRGYLASRFNETFNLSLENKGIYQRLLIWKSSRDMFLDNKIFGVGNGIFESFYPFYQAKYITQKPYDVYRTHANNTHNEILEILTQTGVVGFSFYVLFFITLFICLFKTINRKNLDARTKLELIAFVVAIVAMLVDNMLNVSLHFTLPMMTFWFIVGSAIQKIKRASGNIPPVQDVKKIITKIILAIFCILCATSSCLAVRYFLAEKYYFQGLMLTNNAPGHSTLLLRAKKYMEKARKLHKYEVNNLYELGNTNMKLGLSTEAVKYYKEAILANPGYDEIYFNAGYVYYKNGDTQNAEKYLFESHKINPINTPVLYCLFNISVEKKEIEKSIEYMEKAIKIDERNYAAWTNLGTIHSMLGDFETAKKYYLEAISLNPDYSFAKTNLEKAQNREPGILVPFNFELFKER